MEQLKGQSAETVDAYHAFKQTGDPDQLDAIIDGVLEYYLPPQPGRPPIGSMPPGTELMADLGLDSLTMTEITFFTEELFGVVFEIEELMPIVTIGDLKTFMRTKITASPGSDRGQSN